MDTTTIPPSLNKMKHIHKKMQNSSGIETQDRTSIIKIKRINNFNPLLKTEIIQRFNLSPSYTEMQVHKIKISGLKTINRIKMSRRNTLQSDSKWRKIEITLWRTKATKQMMNRSWTVHIIKIWVLSRRQWEEQNGNDHQVEGMTVSNYKNISNLNRLDIYRLSIYKAVH